MIHWLYKNNQLVFLTTDSFHTKLVALQGVELQSFRGSRDGAVVRARASHQCVPGSIPGPGVICGLSLLLVLVLAPRVFFGFSGFPPSSKINIFKFQFDRELEGHGFISRRLLGPGHGKCLATKHHHRLLNYGPRASRLGHKSKGKKLAATAKNS